MEPEKLAAASKRLTAWAEEHAPEPEPPLRERLREHIRADPTSLPIVTRPLQEWDRPNFQVAIDAFLADRTSELVGLSTMPRADIGLAELAGAGGWYDSAIGIRTPEHVTVPLGEDESVTCVQLGLWLVADHDVLFVLTTNAPERIEPALAARPGRIDQAVQLSLPDVAGRRRLLALYGEGLQLPRDGLDDLVGELDGTSPAFIRELLRRAALVAAEESADGPLRVTEGHLRKALAELRAGAGELTLTLLGDGAVDGVGFHRGDAPWPGAG